MMNRTIYKDATIAIKDANAVYTYVQNNIERFTELNEKDWAQWDNVMIECAHSSYDWTDEELDNEKPTGEYIMTVCAHDCIELVYEVETAGYEVVDAYLRDVALPDIFLDRTLEG